MTDAWQSLPDAEDWRDGLMRELGLRHQDQSLRFAYYEGHHPLPTAPNKNCSEDYKRLAFMGQANFMQLVVDAVTERLSVQGVRFSDQASGGEDLEVWEDVWQSNELDSQADLVHDTSLICGRSFVALWPTGEGTVPLITAEDPDEVIVEYAPGRPYRERRAALKVFYDRGVHASFAQLWTPEFVYRWVAPGSSLAAQDNDVSVLYAGRGTWQEYDGDDNLGPVIPNIFGAVPVVEFPCRPNLRGHTTPEISDSIISVQDRINKVIFDQLITGEFQSFPQRYALGIEPPRNDLGQAENPLPARPERVWVFDNPDARVGQLDAADLRGFINAVQIDIQRLATMTKTPVYYLLGQLVNVSADAVRAAEAGLVKKVERHQRIYGEAWEDVIRLALTAMADPRSTDMAMELDWEDAESRSLAERVDAATKRQAVGVPWRQNMEDIGYSPQQIARMEVERAEEALLTPPTPIPTGPGAQPAPAASTFETAEFGATGIG